MKQGKRTLVILIPGFPENEADSTCLPMQQSFVRSVKELYPDLKIIVLAFQYPYFSKRYDWFGTTVISFDGKNKGGLPRLLLRKKILATLKEINSSTTIIGLLSFWLGECAWVGKKFGDSHGIKHYCWLMGQDARKGNKYAGRVKPKPGELIALSDFLQDEFERNYSIKPSYVVPAAIDPRQFTALPKEKDIDVLAAGSLIPLKRYEIFIEAVAEIKKQIPTIKAILIGDGPEKNKLNDLIARSGLESNISMVGELSYPNVLQMMQRSKVFLHPSSYEGFSCVSIEALYAGAHVISFCKTMKQEVEHWYFVKTKEEMSRKSLSVLTDPATDYHPVAFSVMTDISKKIIGLFSEGV